MSRARKKLRISRKSSMRASWDFTTFVNLNKTVPNRRTQCSQSLLKSLIHRWFQVVPSWQLQLTIMPTVLGVGDGDKSILGEMLCSTCHRKQHRHITWCEPGRCTHQALLWSFQKLLLLWVSLGTAPMIRIWCLLFIEFSSVPFYTDFHHWKFLIRAWNSSAGALVWDKIHTSSPWPLVNMELSKFSFPEMLPIFIRTSLTRSDMNETPINPGKSRYSLF